MSARLNATANSAGIAATVARPRLETDAACLPASPDKPGPTLCSVSAHRSPCGGLSRLERTELALVELIVNLRHLRDSLHQLGRLDLEPAQARMVMAQAVEFLDLIGNPKLD